MIRRVIIVLILLCASSYALVLAENIDPLPELAPITPENIDRLVQLAVLEGRDRTRAILFSPDSTVLASVSSGAVRLWDMTAGTRTTLVGRDELGAIWFMAFNSDGSRLVVGGDGVLQIWNLTTREQLPDSIRGGMVVKLNPDGTMLATWSFGSMVRLWDVTTSEILFELDVVAEPLSRIWYIAFSPDGALVATAGGVREGRVQLWDTATGRPLVIWVHPGVADVVFSPDGALLASVGREEVRLYEVNSLEGVGGWTPRNLSWALVFSPDGTMLAFVGGGGYEDDTRTVELWNLREGRRSGIIEDHIENYAKDLWKNAAFSPDGALLITGDRIWDTATQERLVVLGGASDMMLSPDGKLLALIRDDAIELWGVPSDE
jgi:WD40 repeat protein